MSLTRFVLALGGGLAISCGAAAHSELHSADWCANGVVRYTGEFSVSSDELHAESARQQTRRRQCLQETGADPNSGDDTCGIFDPPYELAVAMARDACGDSRFRIPAQLSRVAAFIVTPTTFNDPNHHATFNLDSGITGLCGVCEVYGDPVVHPPGGHD